MDISEKVCLNHTDTPAASRCTCCFKPICASCILSSKGEDFCSEKCQVNHERTASNISDIKSRDKGGFGKTLIRLIILGAIAYGAWMYKDQIMNMINKK